MAGKQKINHYQFDFIFDARSACSGDSPPFLLIFVPSLPAHLGHRAAIRNTWGSVVQTGTWPRKTPLKAGIQLVFLLGAATSDVVQLRVQTESHRFGDIVQEDFVDSYYNLTLKMVMGLKWAAGRCGRASYVLKADEDVFVNIPRLLEVLREEDQSTILGSRVYRYGKWKVDLSAFPGNVFPNYASGNTYVLPGQQVARLYQLSEYVPYIPIEDAFITGLLGGRLDKTIPGFTFWLDKKPKACEFENNFKISGTGVSVKLMTEIWAELQQKPNCTR